MLYSRTHATQRQQDEPDQVKNSAGGYVQRIPCFEQLERFLILGTEGGTYYAGQQEHTFQAVKCVDLCLKEDGPRTVALACTTHVPKQETALYVIAKACTSDDAQTRAAAYAAIPSRIRTGSQWLLFNAILKNLGKKYSQGLKRAAQQWYESRFNAYQALKYQNRYGFRQADVLRMARPKLSSHEVAKWALGKETSDEYLLAYEELKKKDKLADVLQLVDKYKFTHEMVPTKWHAHAELWEALIPHMPVMATVRSLTKLRPFIKPLGSIMKEIVSKLGSQEAITKSRIHPANVLMAIAHVEGMPEPIMDALEGAFYLSFRNVEPTGKAFVLGVDVSASMAWGDRPTPMQMAACMAMVTARTEANYAICAFSHKFVPLNIKASSSLLDVVNQFYGHGFGGTDCAIPMQWAEHHGLEADVFMVYTDNETWYGDTHPYAALESYRQASGRNAKSVVAGFTATEFSIARGPNMLDVVGLDSKVPEVIQRFSAD